MSDMFALTDAFNQNLAGWCVELIPIQPSGFDDSATAWTDLTQRPQWGRTC
jgi:hypothetical protein